MFVALKHPSGFEVINSDHIVRFYDDEVWGDRNGQVGKDKGVTIVMTDNKDDENHSFFTGFLYGSGNFNARVLHQHLNGGDKE